MPVSAQGASSAGTRRTVSSVTVMVTPLFGVVMRSGREGGEHIARLAQGGFEGGGRAQHDQVAMLGPDELEADGQSGRGESDADGGGGRARHVERVGRLHP